MKMKRRSKRSEIWEAEVGWRGDQRDQRSGSKKVGRRGDRRGWGLGRWKLNGKEIEKTGYRGVGKSEGPEIGK